MPDRECCDCDCHYVGAVEPNNICNSNGKCSVCGNKPGFENRFKDNNALDKAYITRLVDDSFRKVGERARYRMAGKVGGLALIVLLFSAAIYAAYRSYQPTNNVGLGLPEDARRTDVQADISEKILHRICYRFQSGKVNINDTVSIWSSDGWSVDPKIIHTEFRTDLDRNVTFRFSPSDANTSEEIQRVDLYLPDTDIGRYLYKWLNLVKNRPDAYLISRLNERKFKFDYGKVELPIINGFYWSESQESYIVYDFSKIFVDVKNLSVRINDETEDSILVVAHISYPDEEVQSAEIIAPSQEEFSDWQAWLAEKRLEISEFETIRELSDLNFRFDGVTDLRRMAFVVSWPDPRDSGRFTNKCFYIDPNIIDAQVRQDDAPYTTLIIRYHGYRSQGYDNRPRLNNIIIQVPDESDKEEWDNFLDRHRSPSPERPRRVLPRVGPVQPPK